MQQERLTKGLAFEETQIQTQSHTLSSFFVADESNTQGLWRYESQTLQGAPLWRFLEAKPAIPY